MAIRTEKEEKVRLVVPGEGVYEVPVSEGPVTFAELLGSVGISNRRGQLFLDGRPVSPDAPVAPGSEAAVLPMIHGG